MSLNDEQLNQIKELKKDKTSTIRVTVNDLEDALYEPLKLLDHGFVRVVDYMGDDAAIVQAARVSYGKGTKKINQDAALIRYLLRHHHTTPFEMCEIKFHIKMPIFVARQWIRHRTANVNEYSARYSVLEEQFYIPNAESLAPQSNANHQGRSSDNLSLEEINNAINIFSQDSKNCYQNYQILMNVDEKGNPINENYKGVARELARMNLPINIYTEWYWKIDLHNLLHFLHLRADDHAQYEIRVYAKSMLDIVKKWVPITYEAFLDYRVNSVGLSAKSFNVIKKLLKGEKVDFTESGLSKREWQELSDKFELNLQIES